MLKNIVSISSLALMLAMTATLPASATEEDAAAPVGSFTSDMAIPVSQTHFTHRDRAFRFAMHHAHMAPNFEKTSRSVTE